MLPGGTEMTPRQHSVLRAILANPGLSQVMLVQATEIDRSTLSDIVRRLTKRGLVKRSRSRKDGRAFDVRLTQIGEAALRNSEQLSLDVEQCIVQIVGPERRDELAAMLASIASSAERTVHAGAQSPQWGGSGDAISIRSPTTREPSDKS